MSKLKSVTIPKNVKTISAFAFNECANLTTIIWNAKSYDELDSFVHSPFYGIRSLITSFTFGNDVETIPAYLCYEMSNLTSVTIGNNVKIVGEHAFEKCAKLESVPIGNSVTNIEEYAFYDCSSLTSIEIPNSVTHIGVYAFRNCISLTSVTIPNSVISIGGSAFSGCSGLTSITIGNSLTNVGNQAFEGCNSLTSVHIRDLAVWCGIVFNDPFANPLYSAHHLYLNDKIVTKLIIPDNVASIGDCTFTYCADLTSVTIPNSVTHIGVYAFGFCSGLTSVTIPNSVTSIGDAAFVYCSGLTSVTIPNSVTSIGLGAFGYCSSLTSVTIPDGVTSIENHTFEGCSSLTSITIPNSVTSVGERAFYGCSGLTSLTIGISVADIGEEAFAECTNFDWITCYASTVPNITSSTFENIGNKKYIYLYVPENRQRAYLRNEYWGEFDVQPISSTTVETEDVQVTSTETTADIVWPTVTGAASYELVIRNTNGDIICTLVFNAKGQLTSITFNAPGRDNAPDNVQTAGFSFTVSGLDAGTTYNYTLTAKDSGGNILDTRTGSFKTAGTATAVEETEGIPAAQTRKVMRDGVMYILMPDGRMYDVQGTEL